MIYIVVSSQPCSCHVHLTQAKCGVTALSTFQLKIPGHTCLFLSLPDSTTALGRVCVYWGDLLNQIKSRSRDNADNQMRS